jgi:hypothetical protein
MRKGIFDFYFGSEQNHLVKSRILEIKLVEQERSPISLNPSFIIFFANVKAVSSFFILHSCSYSSHSHATTMFLNSRFSHLRIYAGSLFPRISTRIWENQYANRYVRTNSWFTGQPSEFCNYAQNNNLEIFGTNLTKLAQEVWR